MASGGWSWSPDPQGVSQIIELLIMSTQPDTEVQERVVIGMAGLSGRDDFSLYLMFIFNNHGVEGVVRQSAGLYLKSCLGERYCSFPGEVKSALKSEALRSIGDKSEPVRNTVGIIVSQIVELELGFEEWPNLLLGVTDLLTNSNELLVHGSLGVVEKLCEDHSKYVRQDQLVLEKLFPNLINLFGSPHEEFTKMAVHSVNQFLLDMPGAFLANLQRYVEGIFYLASNKSPHIRRLVCTAFSSLVERRVENIRDSLPKIVEYMLHHTSPKIEAPVALEACEFWISVSDSDVCHEIVLPILPQLLGALFDCLILTDAEMSLMESGGLNSSEVLGEVGGGWNLRKCAAMCFEDLSSVLGGEFFQAVLPIVQIRINSSEQQQQQQHPAWKIEESCILGLGKIAKGCGDQLATLFDSILPILGNKTSHPNPYVRSIACWSLGAYAPWICTFESYFPHVLAYLLERVHDEDARVKVAACAALGDLIDQAESQLESHFHQILNCIMCAFEKYPEILLPKLYDPLTSLFENSGEGAGEGAGDEGRVLVAQLMPLLLSKLGSLEDEDVGELSPLFACLAAVLAHGSLFSVLKEKAICQSLFDKTMRVMKGCLERGLEETEDSEMLYDCLSLLSGLTCGLKQDVLPIFQSAANPPFGALLFGCMKNDVSLVRQNSFSLIGDLAKYTPQFFSSVWGELMKVLVDNLQIAYPVVCNNAAWAIVAVALSLSSHFDPYLPSVLENFVFLIDYDDIQPTLSSSLTLALGHLCSATPSGMASQFDVFLEKWCENISKATDSEEKELSFQGVCVAIRANPSRVYGCLEPLVRAFYEYREEASEEIAAEMRVILQGLINGAPSNWEQMMKEQLASPEVMQFLKGVCN